jgi:hypothetical protein
MPGLYKRYVVAGVHYTPAVFVCKTEKALQTRKMGIGGSLLSRKVSEKAYP